MTKELKVEGMSCNHCRQHVQNALSAVDGVTEADVDLASGRAEVKLDKPVDNSTLVKAVEDAGYKAEVIE